MQKSQYDETVIECLLLLVQGDNALDSGLGYQDAGRSYAAAKNSGEDSQETGLAPPNFTCVPVAGSKELKLIVREQQWTRLLFENLKLQNIG